MKQQQSSSPLIGAIDQGTSSTRFLVFEKQTGHVIASSQMEIKRITPKEGWVEIDPASIISSVHATIANVYNQLITDHGYQDNSTLLSCIGICNQRESTVAWDAQSGQPLYNAIVWMDNRTKYIVDEMIDSIPGRDFNRFKDKTGLPMSTYFSAFKLKWLIDNVDEVKMALRERRLLFGTVDSWILWNLSGGKHMTDVTNASRTFLMDIETLQWDKSLCKHFKIPMNILPEIRASADNFGSIQGGPFNGTPITGVIGDQSAALFGHNCLQIGQTKATFGTGCFIMQNIGPGPINAALSGVNRDAKRGLVTTVGYKLGDRPACYALEGSIKIAGAALTWLRDNIQLIENYEECDLLVNKTTHSAGVFFVPALGGLYSPYWDPNAAGLFIGLSQFTRREHLVRATFDSIAFQTNDILSLMRGVANGLMIDGGLCKSDNLCQILADITGYDIIRPAMCETSALGAAMVAGYGAGLWSYESMMANSIEPLDASLSYQSQTHHYPSESMSYDEEHIPESKAYCNIRKSDYKIRTRTKSMTSNEAAARHRCDNTVRQNRAALAAANQQQIQHLKSANGVNDDAGGGKEGDRGGGNECRDIDDHDDCISATSSGAMVTSVATTSATGSGQSMSENGAQQTSPIEVSLESNASQTVMVSLKSVSGYSSGDNFEQATNLSGVSMHCRVDSPLSQITEGVMSLSMTPCMDLDEQTTINGEIQQQNNLRPHQQRIEELLTKSNAAGQNLSAAHHQDQIHNNTKAKNLSYNLKNFFDQQLDALSVNGSNKIDNNIGDHDNNKIDSGDLVHEFGGRDSYGEDGYDSSSPSFDSYVTDDNDDDVTCDKSSEQPLSLVATENYVSLNGGGNSGNIELNQQVNKQQELARIKSNRVQRVTKRQRKTSVSTKQLDVFQPYISLDHRTDLVGTWRQAVERSMQWTKIHHEEVKRIDYQRLSSLPISLYMFFSIGMIALSSVISINGSLFAPTG